MFFFVEICRTIWSRLAYSVLILLVASVAIAAPVAFIGISDGAANRINDDVSKAGSDVIFFQNDPGILRIQFATATDWWDHILELGYSRSQFGGKTLSSEHFRLLKENYKNEKFDIYPCNIEDVNAIVPAIGQNEFETIVVGTGPEYLEVVDFGVNESFGTFITEEHYANNDAVAVIDMAIARIMVGIDDKQSDEEVRQKVSKLLNTPLHLRWRQRNLILNIVGIMDEPFLDRAHYQEMDRLTHSRPAFFKRLEFKGIYVPFSFLLGCADRDSESAQTTGLPPELISIPSVSELFPAMHRGYAPEIQSGNSGNQESNAEDILNSIIVKVREKPSEELLKRSRDLPIPGFLNSYFKVPENSKTPAYYEDVARVMYWDLYSNGVDVLPVCQYFWINQIRDLTNALNLMINGISGFVILGVAIVMVIVINLMMIHHRFREIAIRRCEGATKTQIICQFLLESMIISSIAAVFGIIGGQAGAYYLAEAIVKVNPYFDPWTYVYAVVFSILFGTLTNIIPAFRAASIDPVKILHRAA
ncbi:MAG: ABC transporter permease [Planctomycetes bacterium]|nr:ABC transporter permease [Planctomycetota bacterium]